MFCMKVRALAFRDPFRQVALAGLCLPIRWLILFDLGRFCPNFADLGKTFANIGPKRVSQNNKSINYSIQIAKHRPKINQKSTNNPPKVNRDRFGKKVGSRTPTNCENRVCARSFLAPLGRFWVPFWAELDPEGGPKIVFLGIILEK